MGYDLEKLIKLKSLEDCYIPSETQKERIIQDVLLINMFLEQAHRHNSKFPKVTFMREDIQFYKNQNVEFEFCKFFKQHKTPTGKEPKYFLCLSFYIGNVPFADNTQKCTFGEIFYSQNGDIGKINIIAWFNHVCYTINVLRKKKKDLEITKIESSGTNPNDYEKIVLYKSK